MITKDKRQIKATVCAGYFGDYENDPVGLLAAEIVIHAIADWRELVKARKWENINPQAHCNFNELRLFFKSDWCEFILHKFDMSPAAVLALLEAELADAMQQPPTTTNGKG